MNVPDLVTELKTQLEKVFLDAVVTIDVPEKENGYWYIDAMLEEIWAVICYWSEAPAGICWGLVYREDKGFGEGPDEAFSTIEALIDRLVKLEKEKCQEILEDGSVVEIKLKSPD